MKKLYSLIFIIAAITASAHTLSAQSKTFKLGQWTEIQNSIIKELNKSYVDSLPVDRIMKAGIDAMLEELDPYTIYIPEEENEDFQMMISNTYGGIGAIIKKTKGGNVIINEPFRADGLDRILFRCPHCGAEGKTEGKGITLTCHNCGVQYELTETGYLKCLNAESKFTHIPDWYKWEREQVRASLQDGSYKLETDVDIAMMVDFKAIYKVGTGKLIHDENGFKLTGCDGKLEYNQPALACYGLYADYYWYELGDVICIGNHDALYYCFPKKGNVVAKTRLATEELYKMKKTRRAEQTANV